MSPQNWGGDGGGSGRGGGRGKNDCGGVDDNVTSVAAGGGSSRHYMWREEQIKQFAYFIRSGEEKQWWVMNNYKLKDAHGSGSGWQQGWWQK
jgi:hypothetical protein